MQPTNVPLADDEQTWAPLSPGERESFLTAIERHRNAAWRVTLVSYTVTAVATFVVAALMSPLFYSLLGLALDLINLIVPTPNIIGQFMQFWIRVQDEAGPIALYRWFVWIAVAAVPGLLVMSVVLLSLRRALLTAAHFENTGLVTRAVNRTVLAEQRFYNVIQEMAIAANLTPPEVLVAETSIINAGVFGHDEAHARIVVATGLLEKMNRSEMQGIAAHLIGSIANGDMRIGERTALTLAFFNLVSRFATLMGDAGAGRSLFDILKALLLPTRKNVQRLIEEVSEAFVTKETRKVDFQQLPLREKIVEGSKLILGGPVVMTGFFGGIVNTMILGPLLALAWRQRKYMADATAVRLTRDPDTLGNALNKIASDGGSGVLSSWAVHLSVDAASRRGLLAGTVVSMFPPLSRRLRALQKLGATLTVRKDPSAPLAIVLLVGFLSSIVGVLICILLPLLIYVSLLLSMLFLGLPVSIVHMLLRWVGG